MTAALPIWTGGRVARAAGSDAAAGAEAAVLKRVVVAYADLLYNQQAVEVARVGIARLDAQVAETRARFDLGQATRTDVAQLQAQRANVAVNLADAVGALAATHATYRAVVGGGGRPVFRRGAIAAAHAERPATPMRLGLT